MRSQSERNPSNRLIGGFCLLLFVLMSSSAWANRARINALGGGEKQFTVEDAQNIWRLPSTLVGHGSLALLETAGEQHTAFGVHLNLGPDTVLGIYGSSEARPVLSDARAAQWSGLLDDLYWKKPAFSNQGDGVTHKGTLFLATSMGDWGRFGVRFGLWGDTERGTLDSQDVSNRGPLVIDMGVGLGLDVGGGSIESGFNVSVGSLTQQCFSGDSGECEDIVGIEMTDTSRGEEFQLNGLIRGRWGFEDWLVFIPYVDVSHRTAVLDAVGVPDTIEVGAERLAVQAGMDLAMTFGQQLTVQPGIGFGYVTWEDSLSTPTIPQVWPPPVGDPSIHIPGRARTEWVAPTVSVALEWRPMDWLAIRSGGAVTVAMASSTLDKYALSEDGVPESIVQTTEDDTDIRYRVGGGLGFSMPNGVDLDVQVQYGEWGSGPYIALPDVVDGFGANMALSARW